MRQSTGEDIRASLISTFVWNNLVHSYDSKCITGGMNAMTRVHQFNFHNFTEDAECHRILNKMRIDI